MAKIIFDIAAGLASIFGVSVNDIKKYADSIQTGLNKASLDKVAVYMKAFEKAFEFPFKSVMYTMEDQNFLWDIYEVGRQIERLQVSTTELSNYLRKLDHMPDVINSLISINDLDNRIEELKEYYIKYLEDSNSIAVVINLLLQIMNKLDSKKEIDDDIVSRIRELVEDSIPAIPTPPQIKILSVTASPPDSDIFYEKEQQVMLDSLSDFSQADLFLDIPDMVNSTLYDMAGYLKNGKHDILQITAHGTKDKDGKTFLLFEQLTEDNTVEKKFVSGEELAQELEKLKTDGVDLKLVILSSCHSAKANEKGVYLSIAETLHKSGIPYVIGMKQSISHDASMIFNIGLFHALIEDKTISEAFSAGKEAIARWESNKKRQNKTEVDIPELFSSETGISRKDFSQHRIEGESSASKKTFTTNTVPRGFIGRRIQIREIIFRVKKHDPMVILKGPGGIGKSTLTARILSFCARDNYKIIEFQGPLTQAGFMEKLCLQIAKTYDTEAKKMEDELSKLNNAKEKLTYLYNQYMHEHNWTIVFDNFEDNQNLQDDCKVHDEAYGLLKIIERLFNGKKSILLVSTRYNVPEFENHIIEVPEYTDTDINKRMYFCNNLQQLNEKNLREIYKTVGKNPRALDLLDALLPGESRFTKLFEIEKKKFHKIINKLKAKLRTGSKEEFAPFVLQELTNLLTEEQNRILKALSIYKSPVETDGIAHLIGDFELDLMEKLLNLSLVVHIRENEKHLFYTHRLTAEFFYDTMKKLEFKQLNIKAAEYCNIVFENNRTVDNHLAVRTHYLLAEEFDKAVEVALSVEDQLIIWGYVEFARNLNLESLETNISEEYRAEVMNRLGIIYLVTGEPQKALEYYEKTLEINVKLGNLQGQANSYGNMGNIYFNTGEPLKALEYYEKALDINVKLGNLQGQANQYGNIGSVYYRTGQPGKALEYFEKALEINISLGNLQGQAAQYGNMGLIYADTGEPQKALEYYEKALEINVKLGNLQGQAAQYGNMGLIYADTGEPQKALEYYEKALEINAKLGNLQGQATLYGNMGSIYYRTGEPQKALEYYEKALEINVSLGNLQGQANQYGNMGLIFADTGQPQKALEYHSKALEIDEKLGNIRGMADDYGNMGSIYYRTGEPQKALEHYEKALEINVKLGNLQGQANQYGNMGNIFDDTGQPEKALEYHKKSLDLKIQIGNLLGQANSYGNMGNIFDDIGQPEKALEYYLKAIFIFVNLRSPNAKIVANNCVNLLMKTGIELLRKVTDKMGLDYEEIEQHIVSNYKEEDNNQNNLTQQLVQLIQMAHSVASMPVMAVDRAEKLEQLQQIHAGIPQEMAEIKQFSQFLINYANGTPAIEIKDSIEEPLWQLFEQVTNNMEQESREQ